jgi:phospholipase D
MRKMAAILLYVVVFTFGYLFYPYINRYLVMPIVKQADDDYSISFCFTPPTRHCADEIAVEISKATTSLYLQAYGLTSRVIVDEIISARKRGVEVRAILDKSNLTTKNSLMQDLEAKNIPVKIDTVAGIAHNKVIIIDHKIVITGSFNFTKSADTRNAENVVFIHDKKSAEQYITNFNSRYSKSKNVNFK